MGEWFGTTWQAAGFVALSTVAMYFSVLVGVRVAGRRTLAQLSAFDAVVTIALGSMLAATVLSPRPSYLQGATALVTLLGLQVAVGALRARFPVVRRAVDFTPIVLIDEGERQPNRGPLGPQLTDDELRSALRARGIFDISDVARCILEPNGKLSARRHEASGD